jgi:putative peptide zinc metalloprotease protein
MERCVSLEAGSELPRLRPDLALYPTTADEDGEACWILHDALSNKHFRLGQREVEILGLMDSASVADLQARAQQLLGMPISSEHVTEVVSFLRVNNLVEADAEQHKWYMRQRELASQSGGFSKWVRMPLFFRIPLWNPDPFLDLALPYVRWLGSREALTAIAVCGLVGLLLIIQRLDIFFATFMHFFTLQGLLLYLLILAVVKVCHELGHAFVAKSMGCRVPVIGVAFIVGWPVLYTDTTDAWKVAARHKRLQIGFAGVAVELGIAGISLLLWNLLDDGVLRSAIFLLATTTWVVSLLVNVNPLMRFDGYYLLSDWLKIPNLEPRAFDLGRWWLREKLFGYGDEPPEVPQLKLLVFAFAVWIYRFFLYLGIALLVYNFMFKVAGVLLFAVELIYFIAMPVFREMRNWWQNRARWAWNSATIRTVGLLLLVLALLLLPWQHSVTGPAYSVPGYSTLYVPVAGRVAILGERGARVAAGDIVFVIDSPELAKDIQTSLHRVSELARSANSLGFDADRQNQALVLESELRTERQKLVSLRSRQQLLHGKAATAGVVVDLLPDIAVGDWVAAGTPLLALHDDSELLLRAYVAEQDLFRLQVGMKAVFYPQAGGWPQFALQVTEIDQVAVRELDNLYVASVFGGELAVRKKANGQLATVQSVYQVNLRTIEAGVELPQVMRGVVVITGEPLSLLSRLVRWLTQTLVRESGT